MPNHNNQPLLFDQKLVLNRWLLNLLEVDRFETLQSWLKEPELEGFTEENISHYCIFLNSRLFNRERISSEDLLRYDANIVRWWKQITEKRNRQGHVLYPKYFQYLALLFTEIYLDQYFKNPQALLTELNQYLQHFNFGKSNKDQVQDYQLEDLNKISLWMATGSGKTLLMHCNILQYKHYLKQYKHRQDINRIILLTPNEGLSQQHIKEFSLSGIAASLFSKSEMASWLKKDEIDVIDIHKLADENGIKTVNVSAFEENNLVLVDEGHRGTSGSETGQWMMRRAALCQNGFSFEYSATFGQAVRSSGNNGLEEIYAKSILFDYSYKYFYHDGYGKEYRILNLEDDSNEVQRQRYLTAGLLAFYQQQKIYNNETATCREYLLEKPLWVFVGGSVQAVRTENKRKVSDVVDILLFLADFVNPDKKRQKIDLIGQFLEGQAGLVDNHQVDIFAHAFRYLVEAGQSKEKVYEDILNTLFNSDAPASLHVENLKGADGEIALRLGDNEPFGLINVGDANELCKLCEEQKELSVTDRPFTGSLFQELSQVDSQVNILIGSKKFMEGWDSWRVCTMGLMNVGKKEGSQIIQLFGRGVRLKGKNFSLKRSAAISGTRAPHEILLLETLNIFGVRANYMHQFKEHLEEEGLPTEEEKIEFVMPVLNRLDQKKLKIVRLKEGVDFKRQGAKPTLGLPDEKLERNPIELNWYPIIQSLASDPLQLENTVVLHQDHLRSEHVAFMDLDAIYFEMQQFKNERAWFNLNLSIEKIKQLLLNHNWYVLYIPKRELMFSDFNQVAQWQNIAIVLLKKYCDHFYKYHKAEFESKHLEIRELTPEDPNFFGEYQIQVQKSSGDILAKLIEIKNMIQTGKLRDLSYANFGSLDFAQHLYTPLLYRDFGNGEIVIKPVALNEGEKDFVKDLRTYLDQHQFKDKEIYLLRNQSRGRGMGFFEAGNFYPDFILWVVDQNRQFISFVDPKGIRNIGLEDPKVKFYETVKELEAQLGDPNVSFNSFILSNTPLHQVPLQVNHMSQADFESRNKFFQEADRNYIDKIFRKILTGSLN